MKSILTFMNTESLVGRISKRILLSTGHGVEGCTHGFWKKKHTRLEGLNRLKSKSSEGVATLQSKARCPQQKLEEEQEGEEISVLEWFLKVCDYYAIWLALRTKCPTFLTEQFEVGLTCKMTLYLFKSYEAVLTEQIRFLYPGFWLNLAKGRIKGPFSIWRGRHLQGRAGQAVSGWLAQGHSGIAKWGFEFRTTCS